MRCRKEECVDAGFEQENFPDITVDIGRRASCSEWMLGGEAQQLHTYAASLPVDERSGDCGRACARNGSGQRIVRNTVTLPGSVNYESCRLLLPEDTSSWTEIGNIKHGGSVSLRRDHERMERNGEPEAVFCRCPPICDTAWSTYKVRGSEVACFSARERGYNFDIQLHSSRRCLHATGR